jgi:hypothetical protein
MHASIVIELENEVPDGVLGEEDIRTGSGMDTSLNANNNVNNANVNANNEHEYINECWLVIQSLSLGLRLMVILM